MNDALQRKELVQGLVGVASEAINHNRLEDAEVVIACVRVLRPKVAELDTFEAWIAMKRGFWEDAIRILRNVDAVASNWDLGKALMAFCQFAVGDAGWRASAIDVVENARNAEAVNLVMLLLDPEGAISGHAQVETTPVGAARTTNDFATKQYMQVRA